MGGLCGAYGADGVFGLDWGKWSLWGEPRGKQDLQEVSGGLGCKHAHGRDWVGSGGIVVFMVGSGEQEVSIGGTGGKDGVHGGIRGEAVSMGGMWGIGAGSTYRRDWKFFGGGLAGSVGRRGKGRVYRGECWRLRGIGRIMGAHRVHR